MYYGGGIELLREVYRKNGMLQLPCGNVGVQMGGFYRKEINSVEDLKGLKFRIGGLGGTILSKLGVVPQQIPPADIYPALERGTIDAAEWIGPYDDEKLGLYKVAKYYYYPGWWEGSAMITLVINQQRHDSLPQLYRDALDAACAEQNSAHDGEIRREEPRGADAARGRRRAGSAIPASGARRLLQGHF